MLYTLPPYYLTEQDGRLFCSSWFTTASCFTKWLAYCTGSDTLIKTILVQKVYPPSLWNEILFPDNLNLRYEYEGLSLSPLNEICQRKTWGFQYFTSLLFLQKWKLLIEKLQIYVVVTVFFFHFHFLGASWKRIFEKLYTSVSKPQNIQWLEIKTSKK